MREPLAQEGRTLIKVTGMVCHRRSLDYLPRLNADIHSRVQVGILKLISLQDCSRTVQKTVRWEFCWVLLCVCCLSAYVKSALRQRCYELNEP